MTESPESTTLATIEEHVLATCRKGRSRIGTIAANVRAAMQSPTMPDAAIITAICNLSDSGAIIGEIKDGFLFYSSPQSPISNLQSPPSPQSPISNLQSPPSPQPLISNLQSPPSPESPHA